jgi:hypothetical protein
MDDGVKETIKNFTIYTACGLSCVGFYAAGVNLSKTSPYPVQVFISGCILSYTAPFLIKRIFLGDNEDKK